MVFLAKLNGEKFALNCDLIETIESKPDTVITLFNGKKYIVKDPIDSVVEKILQYKKITVSSVATIAKYLLDKEKGLSDDLPKTNPEECTCC